jgi:hypothetical protein
MNPVFARPGRLCLIVLAAVVSFAPVSLLAQANSASPSSSSTSERWLHVRVTDTDKKGETVRVNVPLEMAEKVLPAIDKDRLHKGKVKINESEMNGVDLKALLDALRTSKDGEYVTVQGTDNDVRVAKQNGFMLVHVTEKHTPTKNGKPVEKSRVEVKVPMKVVDALFSAGKDELDLVAALHALSLNGDTELVSVKSDDSTVHVWLDSKNVSD